MNLSDLFRQWKPIAALTIVGALIGALIGFLLPPVYTAETRLAVGSGSLNALNVPGFPTASEKMASNYARWIGLYGVSSGEEGQTLASVSASPIPESNVLRIEAEASTPEDAKTAAAEAAVRLKSEVNHVTRDNDPEAALTMVKSLVKPIKDAELAERRAEGRYRSFLEDRVTGPVVRDAKAAWEESAGNMIVLETRQQAWMDRHRSLLSSRTTEANLVDIGHGAEISKNSRPAAVQRYGMLGLMAGLAAGLLFAWLQHRRRLSRNE